MGLLAAAILEANNIRDIDTDRLAGKRTLAVILGRDRARRLYAATVVAAAGAGATKPKPAGKPTEAPFPDKRPWRRRPLFIVILDNRHSVLPGMPDPFKACQSAVGPGPHADGSVI